MQSEPIGSFGDVRRAERGAWLFERIVATGSLVLRQVGGTRAGEIAAHRLLDSPQVTVAEIIETLGQRTGEHCRGRRIIAVPNLRLDDSDPIRAELARAEDFVSYWAVPLITKGRVEGVLEVMHRQTLAQNGDWSSFLETLAGQAAIAIDNAGLFNDVQRTNAELQLAYDSTLEGWSKALDLRDKETEGHTLRVTSGTLALARAMEVPPEEMVHIRRGALLQPHPRPVPDPRPHPQGAVQEGDPKAAGVGVAPPPSAPRVPGHPRRGRQ